MAKIYKYDKTRKAKISNRVRTIRILVTAGPTREPIDPVRFISNYSTGTMGYAIAKAAKDRGHRVILVSGPTHLVPPRNIKVVSIITAKEMFKAVKAHIKEVDCVIMAAAVSDFRPAVYRSKKIKPNSRLQNLPLRRNVDILYWLSRRRGDKMLVGFCMETENLISNACKKLLMKKLDMIVANRIDKKRSPFGPGKTDVVIIGPNRKQKRLTNITKERIARILLDKIGELRYKKTEN